jgi:hypothetical protein
VFGLTKEEQYPPPQPKMGTLGQREIIADRRYGKV